MSPFWMAAVRILFVALALLLVLAGPASAVPEPSYSVSPANPEAGEPARYTSTTVEDPGEPAQVSWDFNYETDPENDFEDKGPIVFHTFNSHGMRLFRMRVQDADNDVTKVFAVLVNAPPTGQFGFSPLAPVAGQLVFFQSFSYDVDGSVVTHEWDFDGGPFPDFEDGDSDEADVFGSTAFATAGDKTVRLRVRDNLGATRVVRRTVTVAPVPSGPANRLPVAQFAVAPLVPDVGDQVSLKSFSYDPDGSIVSQRWDLDGDGDFDENVAGKTAFTVFTAPGPRVVRLEVRDSAGAVQTETQTVEVKAQARPVVSAAGPSLMYPFPVIRLAGSVIPSGARVRTLEVRAPARSKVTVKCWGKSCPAKRFAKTAARRRLRFERMARFLRAGTVITVAVRKGNLIGKHTRWLIRGAKLPQRKDSCLYPGKSKPRRCPRS